MFRTAIARRAAIVRPATLARPAQSLKPAFGRMYSDSRSEGSVATSQGFGKREKAQEDQYMRAQEKAKLDKLRELMQKQREELAKLEAEHDELAAQVADGGEKK